MTKSKYIISNLNISIKRIIQSKRVDSKIMQQLTKDNSISQIIEQIGNRAKVIDKNNNESLLKKGLMRKPDASESQNQAALKTSEPQTVNSNSQATSTIGLEKSTKKPDLTSRAESDSKLKEDSTAEPNLSVQDIQKAASFYKENKETVDKAGKFAYQNREAIAEGAKVTGSVVKNSQILKDGAGKAKTANNPLQSLFGFGSKNN